MVNKISKRRISSWISIGCFILVRSLDQSVLLVGQMRSAVFAPPGNTQMDICSLNTRPGRATIMSFWFFAVNRESFETSDQNDEKIWSEQQKIYFVLHVDVHHVGVHHVGVHHVHVHNVHVHHVYVHHVTISPSPSRRYYLAVTTFHRPLTSSAIWQTRMSLSVDRRKPKLKTVNPE